MNTREYRHECRRQLRLERLGDNDPCCIVCGEKILCCLELHHIAGKAFSNTEITVCRNHHRMLSDKQKDHPPILPGKPTRSEREGRELLGIADLMELLGAPSELIGFIRQIGLDLVERGQLFRGSHAGDEL